MKFKVSDLIRSLKPENGTGRDGTKLREFEKSRILERATEQEAHDIAALDLINIIGRAKKYLTESQLFVSDALRYNLIKHFDTYDGRLYAIGCEITAKENRDGAFKLRYIQRTNVDNLLNILGSYEFPKAQEVGAQ